MNELIEILEERFTPVEIIKLLDGIDKFDVDNYAVEHDICPLCLGELVIRKYKEYRGEFWDFLLMKNCDLVCLSCGEVF